MLSFSCSSASCGERSRWAGSPLKSRGLTGVLSGSFAFSAGRPRRSPPSSSECVNAFLRKLVSRNIMKYNKNRHTYMDATQILVYHFNDTNLEVVATFEYARDQRTGCARVCSQIGIESTQVRPLRRLSSECVHVVARYGRTESDACVQRRLGAGGTRQSICGAVPRMRRQIPSSRACGAGDGVLADRLEAPFLVPQIPEPLHGDTTRAIQWLHQAYPLLGSFRLMQPACVRLCAC